MDRRHILTGAFAAAGVALVPLARSSLAQAIIKEIHDLKPGDFTWHPERAPDGPVAIVVSIPDQRVHVYRNGIRIAVSTCSTGKPGHATPTGVFTILEKDKNHRSSTYDDAPMPNMNRLTWNGIALHAGNLPGYPASHGCIRLPTKFSELLFTVTHVGTPVIVSGSHADPADVIHPGLVLSQDADRDIATVKAGLAKKTSPWQATVERVDPAVAIIASSADKTVTVLSDGEIVIQGQATIVDPDRALGNHVFVLIGSGDGHGLRWQGIAYDHDASSAATDISVLGRVLAAQDVQDAVKRRMHPGTIFVTTDLPAAADTRSGRDFVIMSQDIS